jgi:hypothetical protein
MKESFKVLHSEKLKKKDFDKAFYEHYFLEISNAENLPLESFFHPKNSKSKTKDSPKTINSAYIDSISKSKSFVDAFLYYLTENLEAEYREIIDSKIHGLFNKWEHEYQEAAPKEKDKVVDDICAYIEKNKKCKLPWTVREVQEAIMSVRKLFEQPSK